jgi:hypothetical protein
MTVSISGTNGVTFPDSSLQSAAASPYTLKNKIINGAMVIDQRNAGASVTPTTTGAANYTLDRWAAWLSVSSKFSVQQNAASVTPPTGFINYLGVTSLAATTVSASDYYFISQQIEGLNTYDLDWGKATAKTVTLSFWVRSSLTGTFGGGLRNSAVDRCYPFSYTISTANTWTQISVTIAGDTSGTWLTTNGIGIHVIFGLGIGTNFSTTAGAWAAGNYASATGVTSVVGTSGATWYVTGVQLEQNTSATPFERRLYNQELANCQRYYQIIKMVSFGLWVSATTLRVFPAFKATMRTTPTMYLLTSTPYAEQISAVGITGSGSTITDYSNTREDGADVSVNGFSGRAYGQFAFIFFNTLAVGAEL